MTFKQDTDSVLPDLRKIWRTATPDSVGADLERVKHMVAAIPEGPERDEGEEFLATFERLAHWLQDL